MRYARALLEVTCMMLAAIAFMLALIGGIIVFGILMAYLG